MEEKSEISGMRPPEAFELLTSILQKLKTSRFCIVYIVVCDQLLLLHILSLFYIKTVIVSVCIHYGELGGL